LSTSWCPVVINADLIIAGLQSGAPAQEGADAGNVRADIDVPWIAWNSSPGAPMNGVGIAGEDLCAGSSHVGLMMSAQRRSTPRREDCHVGRTGVGAAEPAVSAAVASAPALAM
jgi:hypothetical protein